jgi:hypothetical protein
MSDPNEVKTWTCPVCKKEIDPDYMLAHFRSAHRDRIAEANKEIKKFGKRTPFSMRQWGDNRQKRTGPI